MRVILQQGKPDLATVFLADFDGRPAEFVESRQPPIPRERKWVLILSVSSGCPVECAICDAGGSFDGHLSAEEMFAQADYLVRSRYPDRSVPVDHFKIQFARMGEPALNSGVIGAIDLMAGRFSASRPPLCIDTIHP